MGESVLRLISSVPPSVNHYLGYRATIGKNGKAIGMSYCTAEAKKYRKSFAEYVLEEVKNQGWELELNPKQHFYIDGYFYFPRIDMDANNYWKVAIDAITDTQAIWIDDNVVCERVQMIQYDSANPRVEFIIQPVSYIGIFNDAAQLEQFKRNNCIGCNRAKRNCSILAQALEGRVQAGIITGGSVCAKRVTPKNNSKIGE